MPNSYNSVSLSVITEWIVHIISIEDTYVGSDIIGDLNNIGIKNMAEIHLYLSNKSQSLNQMNESLIKVGGASYVY